MNITFAEVSRTYAPDPAYRPTYCARERTIPDWDLAPAAQTGWTGSRGRLSDLLLEDVTRCS
jgi:hypothetical protein